MRDFPKRSRTDRNLLGVCGGIGEYLNIESFVIRLFFILFTLFGGASILLYVILALLMPLEEEKNEQIINTTRPSIQNNDSGPDTSERKNI